MENNRNILDRIDTMKANAVTDAQFKSTWGISMEEHMQRVMNHVKEFDARHLQRANRTVTGTEE